MCERPRHLIGAGNTQAGALEGRQMRDVALAENDIAAVEADRSGEEVKKGCLACSVGADDADNLSFLNIESNVVSDSHCAKCFFQARCGQDGRHRFSGSRVRSRMTATELKQWGGRQTLVADYDPST